MRIILGSSSKFRARLLRESGIEFSVMSPDIDEKAVGTAHRHEQPNPSALALEVANAKADALLARLAGQSNDNGRARDDGDEEGVLVIACDQVAAYSGIVREKPESHAQCREYLRSYALAPAETHSAIVVAHSPSGRRVQGVDVARQHFSPIPETVIDELIAKGDVMHSCGGFLVDDPIMFPYLTLREGDEDSIIGLPMKLLLRLLDEAKSQ